MLNLIVDLAIPVSLLLVGLLAGRVAEHRHLASLARREKELSGILTSALRGFPGGAARASSSGEGAPAVHIDPCFVTGAAVISTDYFKSFLARIRKVIGGELRSYESLCSRARREAVCRMLEQARELGCDAVCNVRLEGFDIAGKGVSRKAGVTMVTVMATGTAYRRAMPGS